MSELWKPLSENRDSKQALSQKDNSGALLLLNIGIGARKKFTFKLVLTFFWPTHALSNFVFLSSLLATEAVISIVRPEP